MSIKNITNQAIALAGIAQACSLVDQLATSGSIDQQAMEASIGSILKIDADNVAEIYGGIQGLRHGLHELDKQMTGRNISNTIQARYAASLVFLEAQLSNRPQMIETISSGIANAQRQSQHFGLLHDNVLANLGDLYQSTLSTINPRVMVHGEPEYLSNPATVNKIRALLLAGVRSAMLWRQCGGARWKFLLFRKKIQDEIKFLLTQL